MRTLVQYLDLDLFLNFKFCYIFKNTMYFNILYDIYIGSKEVHLFSLSVGVSIKHRGSEFGFGDLVISFVAICS